MQDAERRENGVPAWFTMRMKALFLLYPGRTQEPGTILSWWLYLHDLPREKLELAFERAPATSSLYVPSARVVRELALAVPTPTPAPKSEAIAALPEPCALSPDNPFLELARKWEREHLGLGVTADGRMKELLSLLDKHGPQDMPSEQQPRRGVAA